MLEAFFNLQKLISQLIKEYAMHTIQVYIDEELDQKSLNELKILMAALPHVTNVEINTSNPHDLLVEYEEYFNIPMLVMDKLHHKGLHSDIVSA